MFITLKIESIINENLIYGIIEIKEQEESSKNAKKRTVLIWGGVRCIIFQKGFTQMLG